MTNPLVCLGDGYDGIWNLVTELATPESRWEILDWYHLRENLYKVGGSLKRLKQAEALLWLGKVKASIEEFRRCKSDFATALCLPQWVTRRLMFLPIWDAP